MKTLEIIAHVGATAASACNTAIGGNILTSILLGGSLSSLTGLIRNFTIIGIIILIEVNLPPRTQSFMKIMMKISEFDFFYSE